MSTWGPTGPGDTGVGGVADRARSCHTLGELAAAARGCTACPELVASRSTVVVGETPLGSRVVLVGEAPGAEEDRTALPFVGRSGRLLDELLGQAGLARAAPGSVPVDDQPLPVVAVLNVVKCRPPNNRAPLQAETAACAGWLDRQLELLAPELICTLGLSAMQRFLGRRGTLAAARGRVHRVGGRRQRDMDLIATYHPSAALRFGPRGAPRAALQEDLRAVAAYLGRR